MGTGASLAVNLVEDTHVKRLMQRAHLDCARGVLRSDDFARLLAGTERARHAKAAEPIVYLPRKQPQRSAVHPRLGRTQRLDCGVRLAAVGRPEVSVDGAPDGARRWVHFVWKPQVNGQLRLPPPLCSCPWLHVVTLQREVRPIVQWDWRVRESGG